MHPPLRDVLHGRLADEIGEARGERGPRHRDRLRERSDGPRARRLAMHQRDRAPDLLVVQRSEPASLRAGIGAHPRADRLDDEDVGDVIEPHHAANERGRRTAAAVRVLRSPSAGRAPFGPTLYITAMRLAKNDALISFTPQSKMSPSASNQRRFLRG